MSSPKIVVNDKAFQIYIKHSTILARVSELAVEITRDLEGKEPLFVVVLNGAFMFASDLFKSLEFPCEISFIKLASYRGTESTGQVETLIGLDEKVKNRNIVIVEDIVDTGHTMHRLLGDLNTLEPKSIRIASLILKPNALKETLDIQYIGFSIPNDFIVGYGLDYDGYGRNLKDIYQVEEESGRTEEGGKR